MFGERKGTVITSEAGTFAGKGKRGMRTRKLLLKKGRTATSGAQRQPVQKKPCSLSRRGRNGSRGGKKKGKRRNVLSFMERTFLSHKRDGTL